MIKFTFVFIILYWLIVKPKSKKAINNYVIICAVLFFIMIGLRNEAIFGDTAGYVFQFKQLGDILLSRMLAGTSRDRTFWIVAWFLNHLTGGNYTIWFALQAVAIVLPITLLVKRYSVEPMYSWIILFFLGFLFFFMAGLRQTFAMSLTLTGFLVLLDVSRTMRNRVWRFVLLVGVASFFHSSALICLLGLLFMRRHLNINSIVLYLIVLVVALLAGRIILLNMTSFIGQYDNRYAVYGEHMQGATATYFLQQLIIVVPSLFVLRNRFDEPLIAMLFHFSLIGLLMVTLSPVIAEMFRMSFYFSWANLVVFPLAIHTLRNKDSYLPVCFFIFFIFYLAVIDKSAWTTYYFWFEDTSHIIKTFYFDEMM